MSRILSLAVALGAAALSGCGGAVATVSGDVSYDGQPVGDGFITFTPADGKGQDGGGPIANGKYSVTGLPPGPKVVKVIATKKVNFASTSGEMAQKAEEARKAGKHDGLIDPADVIPDNAEGNNAKVELAVGENKHDFALKKPATKK